MKHKHLPAPAGRWVTGAALLGLAMLASQPASAVLVSSEFTDSDCKGYFGDNFDACEIFIDHNDERIELSPVIAKFGDENDNQVLPDDGDETELNTALYDSITGDEFGISFVNEHGGSFIYNPTGDDPGLKYWAVKHGNSFSLFWDVDAGDTGLCAGDAYNLDCLLAANTVTSGDWFTNGLNGLSHITFYNTEPPRKVPAPGVLGLLALGLLGVVAATRRRRY